MATRPDCHQMLRADTMAGAGMNGTRLDRKRLCAAQQEPRLTRRPVCPARRRGSRKAHGPRSMHARRMTSPARAAQWPARTGRRQMDCKEARPLLDASADRELSAVDDQRVQQHIDGCEACCREAEIVRAVSRNVRHADYHRASDALRARIVADLPPTSLPQRRRWRLPLFDGVRGLGGGLFGTPAGGTVGAGWLATLLVALCAVVAGVTLTLRRPADAG